MVIKLSKIFKISGNFMQDGEWVKPDPAFEGEIVVDKDGKFCGYCSQPHISESEKYYGENHDNREIRSLVGAVAKEGKGYSLLLFKLSNDDEQMPLSYEIHDASVADCIWSAKDPYGGFVSHGNAKISLSEMPYSEKEAKSIMAKFCEVDKNVGDNEALICEVDSWQKKALVLWA